MSQAIDTETNERGVHTESEPYRGASAHRGGGGAGGGGYRGGFRPNARDGAAHQDNSQQGYFQHHRGRGRGRGRGASSSATPADGQLADGRQQPTPQQRPPKVDDPFTSLPPYIPLALETQIFVPKTDAEFAAAKEELLSASVLGFDTETKPTFYKLREGQAPRLPDVVQFATADKAFIIQVRHGGGAAVDLVNSVLQNTRIKKVGFGLKSDMNAMVAQFGRDAVSSIVDVDPMVLSALRSAAAAAGRGRFGGIGACVGIRKAVPLVLGLHFKKSKSMTMTNWSLRELTAGAIVYAASDAHAAFAVFTALEERRRAQNGSVPLLFPDAVALLSSPPPPPPRSAPMRSGGDGEGAAREHDTADGQPHHQGLNESRPPPPSYSVAIPIVAPSTKESSVLETSAHTHIA